MGDGLKKLRARFYRSAAGAEPVREWRVSLDIATVEYGWPVGMPTCRPLGAGLWEVRSELAQREVER